MRLLEESRGFKRFSSRSIAPKPLIVILYHSDSLNITSILNTLNFNALYSNLRSYLCFNQASASTTCLNVCIHSGMYPANGSKIAL